MGEARRRAAAIDTGTVAGCGNCRFYLDDPAVPGGVCRRRPPIAVMLGMKQGHHGPEPVVGTCWPEVTRDKWCGEYEVAASMGMVDFSRLDVTEGAA